MLDRHETVSLERRYEKRFRSNSFKIQIRPSVWVGGGNERIQHTEMDPVRIDGNHYMVGTALFYANDVFLGWIGNWNQTHTTG